MKEPYPLQLPLKKAVERPSQADRISLSQFVATAVAEKVSALETARLFTDYRARVDFKAFDRIMKRRGGESPRKGDELEGAISTAAPLRKLKARR